MFQESTLVDCPFAVHLQRLSNGEDGPENLRRHPRFLPSGCVVNLRGDSRNSEEFLELFDERVRPHRVKSFWFIWARGQFALIGWKKTTECLACSCRNPQIAPRSEIS